MSEGGLSSGIKVGAADWPEQLRGRWTGRNVRIPRNAKENDSYRHLQEQTHLFKGPRNSRVLPAHICSRVFAPDLLLWGPRAMGGRRRLGGREVTCFRGASYSPQGVPAHREPNPANPIFAHICTHTKICLGSCTHVLYTWESDLVLTESCLVPRYLRDLLWLSLLF